MDYYDEGELFEYDLPILASDEVLAYEDRMALVLETDWQQRAWQNFETGSTINRINGLGCLALAITQREVRREVHALEAHFSVPLVPDYLD